MVGVNALTRDIERIGEVETNSADRIINDNDSIAPNISEINLYPFPDALRSKFASSNQQLQRLDTTAFGSQNDYYAQ